MKKKISLICPCYNEEESLELFIEKIKKIFSESLTNYDYELIFVDDNSKDKSESILRRISQSEKNYKVIFNAKNYGPLKSCFNALKYCTGDAIVPMLPVDMQDPPDLLNEFVKKWEEGFDVVYGIKKDRDENWFYKRIRNFYYLLVAKISNTKIPPYVGEYQLIDKKINNLLKEFDDFYPYTRGIIASLSSNTASVNYIWQRRKTGKSNMNIMKLIDLGLNGIISFSNLPIRIFTLIGFAISLLSFLFIVIQILTYFFTDRMLIPGISILIVAIFFFSGLQFLFFGILGEYIYAIHGQVRRPPKYVIEKEKINID